MHLKRLLVIIILFIEIALYGQTDSTRLKIIEEITQDILWNYVSYSKAKEMTDFINYKFISNGYDIKLNIHEFTYELTKDLRKISNDKHIYVSAPHLNKRKSYQSKTIKLTKSIFRYTKHGDKKLKLRYRIGRWIKKTKWKARSNKINRRITKDMFAYGQIKILPGNIGYIEIFDFQSTSYKRKLNMGRIKLKNVMRFLKNTNSIIIDLKANTGGYIFMANYFTSFFVDNPGGYFISTENRFVRDTIPNGRDTTFSNTFELPKQNNFKFSKGKNIYILTSKETFSAAELTTYVMKKLADVKVIGEPTIGGGNGHFGGYDTPYYSAIIPTIKVFDKERGDYSLEGHGIIPDSLVDSHNAFNVAYSMAFNSLKKDTLHNKTIYFKGRKEPKFAYSKYYNDILTDYAGNFRKIQIHFDNGKLYLIYDMLPPQIITPKSKDMFKTEYFKSVKFARDKNNKVTEIQIKCWCGLTESFRKI